MSYEMKTRRGYDFYAATSAMQKAIRRNDPKVAGYFALELYHSNFKEYVWKRLFVISAEDCFGIITKEIDALFRAWEYVNKGKKDKPKGRIFISKAVILLCESIKSRDSDHLQNLIYDKLENPQFAIDEIESLHESERVKIPDYAYDCHTVQGKKRGKTKKEFFIDELNALKPVQGNLFDNLVYQ